MKLEDIRKAYERYSTNLSNINRQLIFAGIAIVWIFRVSSEDGRHEIPNELISPLFFFVLSFIADIAQYLFQSLIWYSYYWWKKVKKKKEETDNVNEPEWPNIIVWLIWLTKMIFLSIGYYKLANYLFHF